MGSVLPHATWLGTANCTLFSEHEQYQLGYRGAVLIFVVLADSLMDAVQLIENECLENKLMIVGFERLSNRAYLDGEPSDYEAKLISRLAQYPVQFEDVHFFKIELRQK